MFIKIVLLKGAKDFLDQLDNKTKIKFLKVFNKVQLGNKGKWFKKLNNDIWEFWVQDEAHWYRILAFFGRIENDGVVITAIIGTHGFIKKSNKTPKQEIDKALSIKNSNSKIV